MKINFLQKQYQRLSRRINVFYEKSEVSKFILKFINYLVEHFKIVELSNN